MLGVHLAVFIALRLLEHSYDTEDQLDFECKVYKKNLQRRPRFPCGTK